MFRLLIGAIFGIRTKHLGHIKVRENVARKSQIMLREYYSEMLLLWKLFLTAIFFSTSPHRDPFAIIVRHRNSQLSWLFDSVPPTFWICLLVGIMYIRLLFWVNIGVWHLEGKNDMLVRFSWLVSWCTRNWRFANPVWNVQYYRENSRFPLTDIILLISVYNWILKSAA